MNLFFLSARFRRLSIPGALLVAFLQRVPVVRVATALECPAIFSPMGALLRPAAVAAATLGAFHSLAGATPLVPSSGTATGVSAQVGTPVAIAYTVNGTQTPPVSWQVNGSIPPGLSFSGLTQSGLVNVQTLRLTGTPTTAGTFDVVINAYEGPNGTLVPSPDYPYRITVTGGSGGGGGGGAGGGSGGGGSATAWLTNVSVRTTMVAGQDPLIVGVTVTGGAKPILVRGAGPALATYGLPNFVPDPRLDLFPAGAASATFSNDNWDAGLAATFGSLGAFPFTPGSKDAAFVQSLSGGYTIQAPATGPGALLVEAYDANPSSGSPRLTNISARNRVGTGNDILIAGFAIGGSGSKRLLIRAVGPKLTDFGVNGVLADPKLEIYDASNTKIDENNDWAPSLATTFSSVGAFALTQGSKDAAIVVTLPAGTTYTVQAKGADGGTGIALIEVYELP